MPFIGGRCTYCYISFIEKKTFSNFYHGVIDIQCQFLHPTASQLHQLGFFFFFFTSSFSDCLRVKDDGNWCRT